MLLIAGVAFAESLIPDDVDVFFPGCNLICIQSRNGDVTCYVCEDEETCPKETPTPTPTSTPSSDPTPTEPPGPTPTPTDVPPKPTPTDEPETVYCHCEQGEGEGAEGRKNCHPVKYNPGHANHEWDYQSTDDTCEGWNH